MEDLIAAFMPKFTAIATTRLTRTIELAAQRAPDGVPTIARDLHSIAGEAGLLGLANIVSLARASEEHAKRLRTTRSGADEDALLASLTELKGAIELIAARSESKP